MKFLKFVFSCNHIIDHTKMGPPPCQRKLFLECHKLVHRHLGAKDQYIQPICHDIVAYIRVLIHNGPTLDISMDRVNLGILKAGHHLQKAPRIKVSPRGDQDGHN